METYVHFDVRAWKRSSVPQCVIAIVLAFQYVSVRA